MPNQIVIAKEEHIEDVKAVLLGVIEPTLKEEGFIQYDLLFTMLEI